MPKSIASKYVRILIFFILTYMYNNLIAQQNKIIEFVSLAKNHIKNANYEEALDLLNNALILNPESQSALLLRAEVYYSKCAHLGEDWADEAPVDSDKFGNCILAQKDLNLILRLSPTDHVALMFRGMVKSELQDIRGALVDINKSISLQPLMAEAYTERGKIKVKQSDFEGAMIDFNKAIQLKNDNIYGIFERGKFKYNTNDYYGAIKDFSKLIELNPEEGNFYHWRALAKFGVNDIDGACLDLSKAGELGLDYIYSEIENSCN